MSTGIQISKIMCSSDAYTKLTFLGNRVLSKEHSWQADDSSDKKFFHTHVKYNFFPIETNKTDVWYLEKLIPLVKTPGKFVAQGL